MNENDKISVQEKIIKNIVLIITAFSLTLAFLSKVHFDLDTRLQILEIQSENDKEIFKQQSENNKELWKRQESKLDKINENLIKLIKDIGEKADR